MAKMEPALTQNASGGKTMNSKLSLILATVFVISGCATDPQLSERFEPVQIMQPDDPQLSCTDLRTDTDTLASDITILQKQVNAHEHTALLGSMFSGLESALPVSNPLQGQFNQFAASVDTAGAASSSSAADTTAQTLQSYQQRRNFLMTIYYKKCS